jgi:ABC-type uncharacterized transport system permease subunit
MLTFIFLGVFAVISVVALRRMQRSGRRYRLIAIACVVIGLLLIPIWVPWAAVGAYTIKCGHAPVIASTGLGAGYYPPSSPYYRKAVSFANPTLFCTENEAQAASLQESHFDPAP